MLRDFSDPSCLVDGHLGLDWEPSFLRSGGMD